MNERTVLAILKTARADVSLVRKSDNIGDAHAASARADVLLRSLVNILEEEQRVQERYAVEVAR